MQLQVAILVSLKTGKIKLKWGAGPQDYRVSPSVLLGILLTYC